MNKILDFLTAEYGYCPDPAQDRLIQMWMDWWRGLYEPFHRYSACEGEHRVVRREMYSLKMAKKCCEDWASLLLNEQTTFSIPDEDARLFLLGDELHEGFLAKSDFWKRANRLVELTFASGTGALRLRVDKRKSPALQLDFISAPSIFPISAENGSVTEVAFLSRSLKSGKTQYYLEVHLLEEDGYVVHNHLFEQTRSGMKQVPLPHGLVDVWRTGAQIPLFAILRPNIVNCFSDTSPMGVSVFANAIDNLKGIDLAFHNFCRDFKLGGKKVFLNRSLTQTLSGGARLTPDDVSQQLFTVLEDNDFDDVKPLIQEFNPSLRVGDNLQGLQGMLDAFSMKVGLGMKMYRFQRSSVSTATEYMGDRQEMMQHLNKHRLEVESFLRQAIQTVLWYGALWGELPAPDDFSPDFRWKLDIHFSDGLFLPDEPAPAKQSCASGAPKPALAAPSQTSPTPPAPLTQSTPVSVRSEAGG